MLGQLLLVVSIAALANGKVALPMRRFLLQQPAFEVGPDLSQSSVPALESVPLVMRLLFEEAERVRLGGYRDGVPQGGDFHSLARSIRPTNLEEVGLQRVVLEFPALSEEDVRTGAEAWLVFQLRQSHLTDNNCSLVLTVYENDSPSMQPLVSVPLSYTDAEPLVRVNITRSVLGRLRLREASYVVAIKDSTGYVHDNNLWSFSNYIDCSLAHAAEVLELRDPQNSPVLLLLSSEMAATDLLESPGRFKRSAALDSSEAAVGVAGEEDLTPTPADDESSCRLMEWTVNIEQLGWDWLVYPERIPLNLCVGSCPIILLDEHNNATSHAVARGLYRFLLGQESKPENMAPCCVPVKYKQFTMLIEKTSGTISLETSSDMSASRCGCR